jgi:uroporphyrinogen decarboxylase
LRTHDDLARLRPLEDSDISYVTDTVDILVKELTVPLLAFAGAPFTVASYLIEGRPSRTYQNTKRIMHEDSQLWNDIMSRLVQHSVAFISAQLTHGAEAFQVFDSWAGALSRDDYDTFVRPHTTEVFAQIAQRHPGVRGIHFGIGCDHLLESMNSVGNSVIGLDWRTRIRDARTRLGKDTVVQGNLDPALVLAGTDIALRGAQKVLNDNNGHPGHIFNLGHGVQPDTNPEVLKAVVDFVHSGGRS